MNFTVPAEYRVQLKENENRDQYPDHARELRKLWNMKVTALPTVIGVFGTVTKVLIQELYQDMEIRGRVETI